MMCLFAAPPLCRPQCMIMGVAPAKIGTLQLRNNAVNIVMDAAKGGVKATFMFQLEVKIGQSATDVAQRILAFVEADQQHSHE